MAASQLCLGSDVVVRVLNAIVEALKADGVHVDLQHVFACEKDKECRRWLYSHFDVSYVLSDVTDFATGFCRDAMRGEWVPTSELQTDLLFVGASCKDISPENMRRGIWSRCLRTGPSAKCS